jgi:hypothetical protein
VNDWRRHNRGAASAIAAVALSIPVPLHASMARVALPGHVVTNLAGAERVEASSSDGSSLVLTVVLRREGQAAFDEYLRRLYDASAPEYRRFSTPEEQAARFGPSEARYESVVEYLRAHDLELFEGSRDRLTLTVRGSRADVERAFAVEIADFRAGDRRFFANLSNPSLPADIADSVQTVIGLSDLAAHRVRYGPAAEKHIQEAKDCLNAPITDYPIPINEENAKKQAEEANKRAKCWWDYFSYSIYYNILCPFRLFIGCSFKNPVPSYVAPASIAGPRLASGTGQKVGLLQFDTFLRSDVENFLALTGAAPGQIEKLSEVKVNGGAPLGPDQSEVLLDVAVVMTLAPDAEVTVYSAPFGGRGVSFQSLLNRAIGDGMDIISNSWAYCEDQTTPADVGSIDSILQTAAAAGITVFSSAGDTGSTCLNGSPDTIAVPAGSPYATAVGGTSANIVEPGVYDGETWWDGSSSVPRTGQGGFGVSRFFERPSYQDALTSSTMRSIPDLSVNADPVAHGLPICEAAKGGCPSRLYYGGTSVGAPLMAAFTAVLNELHGENVGFLNPQIYEHAGTDAFHSPESMGSDFAHVGLGSPNMSELSLALRGETAGPVSAEESRVVSARQGVYADGRSPAKIFVRLRDADGWTVSGKTVTLTADPADNVTIEPPSAAIPVEAGAVVFEVTSLVPETVVLTATDLTDGIVIDESVELTFVTPPAASAGITAFPTTVASDGVEAATITVTLEDALGRPSPGKEVVLSQGAGHSKIVGPVPSETDDAGQIQFTATNLLSEIVTYTAVDVTDGDLEVPGTAVVTFSGGGGGSCVDPAGPSAEDGFAVTPFASGFNAANFFFGGVNWGGCGGASIPAFIGNDVYVTEMPTGALYRLTRDGGAVSSANLLATLGPTLNFPVADAEGNLYALFGATSAAFPSGSVVELDPVTGAVLRTLAGGLKCPSGLAIDPLSGDLFLAHQCFGGVSDDASIHRIRNPRSATPTLEVYVTLPANPNGMLAFAPNGTLYAAMAYTSATPSVARVAGTDQPSPPTVTTLSEVPAIYTVTIAEVAPDGDAASLLVLTSEGLELFDITTSPPEHAVIARGLGSGIIGPDGCMYAGLSNAVYKVGLDDGSCGFDASHVSPTLALTPPAIAPDPEQGGTVELTATVRNVDVAPGTPVALEVRGANEKHQVALIDDEGRASFAYSAPFAGSDIVEAVARIDDVELRSNKVRIAWQPGPHTTALSIGGGALSGSVGLPVDVAASLIDLSVEPVAAVVGETVEFSLDGDVCAATTDAGGVARCEISPAQIGQRSLTASFAGTATLRSAAETQGFTVVGDGVCADFTADGRVLATDAAGILRTAVGLASCELCVCDADGSGTVIVATDSLIALQFSVGLPATLNCPPCAAAATSALLQRENVLDPSAIRIGNGDVGAESTSARPHSR